ncbi:tubulin folding cofactor D C terminal-domain-containing protein [Sporodiniella umbellata]|nr:tubulin folding cofactor D C terminal-domain-containing protein [Sporodiniella umbellata]
MNILHGSLLAIAEISLALWETGNSDIHTLYYKQSSLIIPIVSNLPAKSLTTFGSEHIREAACHLITCLARTNVDISTEMTSYKKLVWSSLERKEENVQEVAVISFGAIAAAYGIEKQEIYEAMEKINVSNPMFYGRRSFALALGTLDYASQVQKDHQENDVDAKRNAVLGIAQIIHKLDQNVKKVISYDDFQYIIASLEQCLTDYSTDQRGDVGSWVRMAAMNLIGFLIPHICKLDKLNKESSGYLLPESISNFVSALLKQSVERIDKVRSCAGKVLYSLISLDEDLNIPAKTELANSIPEALNWSDPSEVYPVIVSLLRIPAYRFELLTGLITSAGGLTESLVRHSSSCLIEYMDNLSVEDDKDYSLDILFGTFIQIFTAYEKQDRVTIPLLDVVGLLYESGTLSNIADEKLHTKLYFQTKKELFKSRNIKKLLSSVRIYIGLAFLDDAQVKTKAMQQLLTYLNHSFPRVRVEVSDQLFSQLSISDDDFLEAMELVTRTDWTQSLEIVKEERDKLYPLLNISKPTLVKKSIQTEK